MTLNHNSFGEVLYAKLFFLKANKIFCIKHYQTMVRAFVSRSTEPQLVYSQGPELTICMAPYRRVMPASCMHNIIKISADEQSSSKLNSLQRWRVECLIQIKFAGAIRSLWHDFLNFPSPEVISKPSLEVAYWMSIQTKS